MKSLIDKSSFEPVDDSSDELVNFFAVMEQLLLFRMKCMGLIIFYYTIICHSYLTDLHHTVGLLLPLAIV